MDAIENRICEIIESHKDEIMAFGRYLFNNGELGYREAETASRFSSFIKRYGVRNIEEGIALTGVKGYIIGKNHNATIGIMGEMDALPIESHPNYNPKTLGAHACGHNAQLTAVAGAVIALADPEVTAALDGDIAVIGVPAEEAVDHETLQRIRDGKNILYGNGGGKREMIAQHKLDDVDIMLGHHAIVQDGCADISISFGSCNGYMNKTVRFKGKSAHAAGRPHMALDAMNASTLAIHALDLQRESFRDKDCVRVHGLIRKSGSAPNVVADECDLEYIVRAKGLEALEDVSDKFDRSMRAGCVATGCGAEIETVMGSLPIQCCMDKEAVIEAVNDVGKISGYRVSVSHDMSHGAGSTDYGDITAIMPLLYFETGGFKLPNHSPEFVPTDEYLAYVIPAMIFALSAYKLLRNGAGEARRVVERYKPSLDVEGYCSYLKQHEKKEVIDKSPLRILTD